MADTTVLTGDTAARKAWANRWWGEAIRETYWYRQGFVGKDAANNIITEVSDLEKEQGDKYTYGRVARLTGAGVQGDSDMEGSEEALAHYEDDVTLDQWRNAVRLKGKLTEQRFAERQGLRKHAKQQLKFWLARKIDNDIFTAQGTSPTKVFYGGDATGTGDIEAGDYMSLTLVRKAKVYAYKADPRIYPVRIKGRDYYVLVMHPDSMFDLKEQDARWDQAQREAAKRGEDNPLFSGAPGVFDGVIMHEHESVPSSTTWGSGINLPGATNLMFGVQAGIIAYANRMSWFEKEFDYGNKAGFCVGAIYGTDKTVFNSADHATVAVRTYRSNN